MTTLKEIAKKLDVSITTVSRVLNNDTTLSVSDKLRSKIIATALRMEYKTPRNRSKIKHRSRLKIAIVHWYNIGDDINESYYSSIRMGAEQFSSNTNVDIVLVYKNNDKYNFDAIEGVNGLICLGKFSRQQINSFQKISKNIVFIDSSPNESIFDSVLIDYSAAVRDVLSRLIKIGYKNIGYIGGIEHVSKSVKLGQKKEFVFRDYLYQKGILNTKFIHVGDFSSESGYKLMKEALKNKLRAEVYFCENDSIAIGALRAIHEKGIKIPEEIGLIGFNDNQTSQYTFPQLSSVHVYKEFMGEQALRILIDKIDGRIVPIKIIIPTKIIIRQSLK